MKDEQYFVYYALTGIDDVDGGHKPFAAQFRFAQAMLKLDGSSITLCTAKCELEAIVAAKSIE